MATIGYVTKGKGDTYKGRLATLTVKDQIRFEANKQREPNTKQPNWRIFAVADNGEDAEIGAAWKRQNQEGKDFISLRFFDPFLPTPIFANLGQSPDETDKNRFAIIWQPPDTKTT